MDVMDVAGFFIDTANAGNPEEDDAMTNMKLNKLLFFAQAASLQRFGRPLFKGRLEAWKYGPVEPDVYQKFKRYGRDGIPDDAQPFHSHILDAPTLNLLCDVYRTYAYPYSAFGLMELTHKTGTPWHDAYYSDQGGRNNVIGEESILDWVRDNPLPIDMPELDVDSIPRVELDPAGNPIWPAEWEGDWQD